MASPTNRVFPQDVSSLNLDIDEVWTLALEQYEQITDISLTAQKNARSFSVVAKDINDRLQQSKGTDRAKAQQTMQNTMICLQRFGGIVAQASSVVFGPSAQCWNAISFIVSAAQGYQAILDGFAALMERSTVFLERLNIDLEAKRQSGIPFDVRVRISTYKVITHFLKVLAHSQKLATSKRQKAKTVFKIVLFNDDAGVKDDMTRMEVLVGDLTDTKISVILQDVQGLARYIRDSEEEINRNQTEIKAGVDRIEGGVQRTEAAMTQLQGELTRKFSQEEHEKNLAMIAKVLRLSDRETWMERHEHYKSRCVPFTGTWLLQQRTTFPSWSDVYLDGVKIITLTGKAGFGKSHLSSYVIDHLLEKYPRGSSDTRRVSVAYYYFQNNTEESLADCLSAIVYQFAKSDPSYAKAVANVCSRPEGLGGPDELWNRCVIDLKSVLQGTYFVVIDGLKTGDGDERMEKALQAVVDLTNSAPEERSLRLFVTARANELTARAFMTPGIADIQLGVAKQTLMPRLSRSRSGLSKDRWELTDSVKQPLWNEDDVLTFTKSRVAAVCKAKPYMATTLLDPKLDVASTLAKGVRGNYSSLQIKLEQIAASDSPEEVLTALKQASEDPIEALRRDIESLDETLTPEEILELNKLLIWVTGAVRPTTIRFLEAAMGDKGLWLEKHIPQKFYKLLRLNEDTGVVEAPRAAEMVELLSVSQVRSNDAETNGTVWKPPTDALQKNEIDLVERVVKTFCGDELFSKFKFEQFFKSKAGKRDIRIRIPDCNTLHTILLRRCLESLCQVQDDDYFAPLRQYAAVWFPAHLKSIDLNTADRKELRTIGSMLGTVLSDAAAIDAWWDLDMFGTLEAVWLGNDDNLKSLTDFLRHPLVAAGYQDDQEKHATIMKFLKRPGQDDSILECIARRFAGIWFGAIRQKLLYFYIAYSIMAKVWHYNSLMITFPSVAQVQRFAGWAREHCGLKVSEAHWRLRIATTLFACDHQKEALTSCLEAETEDTDSGSWHSLLLMAKIYQELQNPPQALECLHKIKKFRGELLDKDPDFTNMYWDTLLVLEGASHKALRDFAAAAACFREILGHDVSTEALEAHEKAAAGLFALWEEQSAHEAAMSQLTAWRNASDSSKGITYWFLKLASYDEFHKCLISTAARTGRHEDIGQMYQLTIDTIHSHKPREMRILRFYHGAVLLHCETSEAHRAAALTNWEDIVVAISGDDSDSWLLGEILIPNLSKHLLDEAISCGLVPLSEAAERYAVKLEALSKVDLPIMRLLSRSNGDPLLALARLRTVAGQFAEAGEPMVGRLRAIFDDWPDETDEQALLDRHSRLAQTFNVLDDDENAIAAWQLLQPGRPEAMRAEAEASVGAEQQDGVASTELECYDGAGINSKSQVMPNAQSGALATVERVEPAPSSMDDLESYVRHGCDKCRSIFKGMYDVYICKRCLDVQLCAPCHQKLLDGDVHPLICNRTHEFLYAPPFNRAQWETMDPEMMVVGNNVVSRRKWLDGLRDQWGLRQDRIDEHKSRIAVQMQAARVLTRWRKAMLKLRAARR